jgi:recombination protein RecA
MAKTPSKPVAKETHTGAASAKDTHASTTPASALAKDAHASTAHAGASHTGDAAVDARRDKALDAALQQIEKSYGKGSIMRLRDDQVVPVEGVSTGALGLDLALGGQGIPRGRICELFGPEGSGKTTVALHVIGGNWA